MTTSTSAIPSAVPTTSRRQFLIAGGAAVAAAVLLGGDVMPFPSGLELLADAPGPRIPVAYLPGSAGATSLAGALAAGATTAVSALGTGRDAASTDRATMSVDGFAGTTSSAYSRVFADALIPSPATHDETIPYYAWTYRAAPAASQSARTRMLLTEADGPRVGLSIATAPTTAGTALTAATTVFTTRPRRDLPTFQPGVYLLGLTPGLWGGRTTLPAIDDPAWAQLPSLVMVVTPVAR